MSESGEREAQAVRGGSRPFLHQVAQFSSVFSLLLAPHHGFGLFEHPTFPLPSPGAPLPPTHPSVGILQILPPACHLESRLQAWLQVSDL